MKKLFFDTWGWTAIAHKGDSHHSEVSAFYGKYLLSKGIPITTDYVLSETITLLKARADNEKIVKFIETLLEVSKEGRLVLERINETRWNKAWSLCKKYKGKPDISFVDFTSFIVMKDLAIIEALTNDRHFEEVGMGFRKIF